MAVSWDNPLGHNIVATRRCSGCGHEDTRTLWSRPLEFAGSEKCTLTEETPLTMPEVAGMLKDAPFRCQDCGLNRATLVAIAVDTSYIPF